MYLKIRPNNQWIATLGGLLLLLQEGISIGWSSPNLKKLTQEDSTIILTPAQISWLISIFCIGAVVGSMGGIILVRIFGARKTIISSYITISAAWICLISANSPQWIFIGRFLSGINVGLTYTSYSIFLADVSSANIRGTMISVGSAGGPIGTLMAIIIDSFLPMQLSSCIYLILCLVGISINIRIMDSPYYLVKIRNIEAARKSIAFYFNDVNVDKELQEIETFVKTKSVQNSAQNLKSKIKDINTPAIRKSFLLTALMFIFPQLSGMIIIFSYMEIIITDAKMHVIDSQHFVIYMNIACILSMLLTVRFIDQFGRRISLIISSIGTSVGLICLGAHFYLLDLKLDAEKLQWLPMISIFIYMVAYPVGYTPLPNALLSELFPDNIKSFAAMLSCTVTAFVSLIISKNYQPLVDLFGNAYMFWIYAFATFMATPYAIFLLPETKGKTFQEIQIMLDKR